MQEVYNTKVLKNYIHLAKNIYILHVAFVKLALFKLMDCTVICYVLNDNNRKIKSFRSYKIFYSFQSVSVGETKQGYGWVTLGKK